MAAKSWVVAALLSVSSLPLSFAQTSSDPHAAVVLQPTLLSASLPQGNSGARALAKEATIMVSDLRGLLLVDEKRVRGAARVVAIGDDFTIAATGDGILIEGSQGEGDALVASLTGRSEVAIYHPSMRHEAELEEDTAPAVIELEYVGKARLLETKAAQNSVASAGLSSASDKPLGKEPPTLETARAWVQITQSKGVIRQGDLLFAEQSLSNEWLDLIHSNDNSSVQLQLRASPTNLSGSVLSLFGSKQWGARGDSVVVDIGAEHGLEPGMALSLEYEDVAMPAAEVLIYRTTARHAQGLVLSAPSPVQVGSRVHSVPAGKTVP